MRPYRSLVCSTLLMIVSSAYSAGSPVVSLDRAYVNKDLANGIFPLVVGRGYLIVAGSNGYWSRVNYQQGDQPSLSAFGDGGTPLPDGVYRYEYRSASIESTETGVAAETSMNDRLASARRPGTAQKVGGTFRVSGGMIIFEK